MTKAAFTGLFVALIAFLAPARAAEETAAPKAYAVLVGISKYDDKDIDARPKAEDDVKALYDVLTNKDHLGLDKDHVRLLLGQPDVKRDSQPATAKNVLAAAQWVVKNAKHDDLVIFAFVGQRGASGERADRVSYFTTDTSIKDMAKSSVTATALGEELDKLQSHRFCALVDVYFKGYRLPEGKAAPEPNTGTSFFKEFVGKDGSEDENPAPGRILYLATVGRTVASPDGDKHGAFTQAVVDALSGKADKEGYEADGAVTTDELTAYLDKELPPAVRKIIGDKVRLRHLTVNGEDAHFVLTQNPAAVAATRERLKKFEEIAKDNKKLTPEIATEGKSLLGRMPKLEAQRNLRKEYQALADGKLTAEKFLENRENLLDGTKLRRAAALDFAEKVIAATKTISREYVKETNQGEMVGWAIKGLYRKVDEKVPEDIAKKLTTVKEMKEKELLSLLADVRQRLGKREDLDKHKDIDHSLLRMLGHLDPYTTFYDPESLEREKGQIQGRFIGIGVQIRKDAATDMLQVITPIMGSPAYRQGIQAGDIITSIIRPVDSFGKALDPPEVISTKGMETSDAVKKILGQPKTKVKVTVQRSGVEKPIEFELTRNTIQVETVLGHKRKADDSWDFVVDSESKIGYIRLTQFVRSSYPDMRKAMESLQKQGVKGLVLDLRFNPGGLLDSARDITDLFIDDGTIVSIRPRVGPEYVMSGKKDDSHVGFPMVCMVNGFSASGSEIVSAALQDHHRALVLGERSYGKGSVQNVVDFERENGEVKSQIKMTTASFWRPSGKNLNKSSTGGKEADEWGVTPDKVVPLSAAERDDLYEQQRNAEIIKPRDRPPSTDDKVEPKDKQLGEALEYLRAQIKTANRLSPKKAG